MTQKLFCGHCFVARALAGALLLLTGLYFLQQESGQGSPQWGDHTTSEHIAFRRSALLASISSATLIAPSRPSITHQRAAIPDSDMLALARRADSGDGVAACQIVAISQLCASDIQAAFSTVLAQAIELDAGSPEELDAIHVLARLKYAIHEQAIRCAGLAANQIRNLGPYRTLQAARLGVEDAVVDFFLNPMISPDGNPDPVRLNAFLTESLPLLTRTAKNGSGDALFALMMAHLHPVNRSGIQHVSLPIDRATGLAAANALIMASTPEMGSLVNQVIEEARLSPAERQRAMHMQHEFHVPTAVFDGKWRTSMERLNRCAEVNI